MVSVVQVQAAKLPIWEILEPSWNYALLCILVPQ